MTIEGMRGKLFGGIGGRIPVVALTFSPKTGLVVAIGGVPERAMEEPVGAPGPSIITARLEDLVWEE
jgi:hypothetical protein